MVFNIFLRRHNISNFFFSTETWDPDWRLQEQRKPKRDPSLLEKRPNGDISCKWLHPHCEWADFSNSPRRCPCLLWSLQEKGNLHISICLIQLGQFIFQLEERGGPDSSYVDYRKVRKVIAREVNKSLTLNKECKRDICHKKHVCEIMLILNEILSLQLLPYWTWISLHKKPRLHPTFAFRFPKY